MRFIDEANVPTSAYIDYRDDEKSEIVMAERVREAYRELFLAHEYANTLKRDVLNSKLATVLGTSKDDKTIPKISGTFLELCKLADFEKEMPVKEKGEEEPEEPLESAIAPKLGISYTINLNLPATPDIEVFNAIFKSLREHLLR